MPSCTNYDIVLVGATYTHKFTQQKETLEKAGGQRKLKVKSVLCCVCVCVWQQERKKGRKEGKARKPDRMSYPSCSRFCMRSRVCAPCVNIFCACPRKTLQHAVSYIMSESNIKPRSDVKLGNKSDIKPPKSYGRLRAHRQLHVHYTEIYGDAETQPP